MSKLNNMKLSTSLFFNATTVFIGILVLLSQWSGVSFFAAALLCVFVSLVLHGIDLRRKGN